MNILNPVILSLFLAVIILAPLSGDAADLNKMKACNEQANAKGFGEGKGEERKAFMKECLSAKAGQNRQDRSAGENEGLQHGGG